MDVTKVDLCGWGVVRWLMAELAEVIVRAYSREDRDSGGHGRNGDGGGNGKYIDRKKWRWCWLYKN